jgi:hypothetical protein
MANDDTPAGFLSRWSRRKVDERAGRPLDEPKRTPSIASGSLQAVAPNQASTASAATTPVAHAVGSTTSEAATLKPPNDPTSQPVLTLADTQQLTPESDYTGFMARGVTSDVKNAAMKKLFTDPHFNVMDRMDVYIDDYGLPDPLPLAMLRQMTSAKTLNLFDDETETPKVVAQSVPAENNSNIEPTTHDHADLRLQPDPTSRPEGTEPKPV